VIGNANVRPGQTSPPTKIFDTCIPLEPPPPPPPPPGLLLHMHQSKRAQWSLQTTTQYILDKKSLCVCVCKTLHKAETDRVLSHSPLSCVPDDLLTIPAWHSHFGLDLRGSEQETSARGRTGQAVVSARQQGARGSKEHERGRGRGTREELPRLVARHHSSVVGGTV